MPWSSSNRRRRLPPNWEDLRRQVKHRAHGKCQATTHHKDCDGTGKEADHIIEGDNHQLSNLQWLSPPCHRTKTAADNRARQAAREAARQRPQEQHPGRRTP